MMFQDRTEAGKKLATVLQEYEGQEDCVVVGLARGGVVVAAEVAQALGLPLDVIIVRKIGAPDNEELALGAVAEEGAGVFNDHLIALLGVSEQYLRKETERQKEIIKQRKLAYFRGKSSPTLSKKTVILVDDGIATGASMKVAIESVRGQKAAKIVLAIPVAPPDTIEEMTLLVDEVFCLSKPESFGAVGKFYREFAQVSDKEVISILQNK